MSTKLIRYELTSNGKRTVGIIQGGYALGILNDNDLAEINRDMSVPPLNKTGLQLRSYFTKDGIDRFGYIVDTIRRNLRSDRNVLEMTLVEKELNLGDLDDTDIYYRDRWQIVVICR